MSNITRVLIAGAGVDGLALAIALRRKGIEPIVVESTEELGHASSGMALFPNGMRAIDAIDPSLAADVLATGAAIPPGQISHFLTARGHSLARVALGDSERTWGAPTVPILRTQLQEILLQHAAKHEVDLRTGRAVTWHTDRTETVTLPLDDGDTISGDVLVGADGVRSAIRGALLGDGEPRYTGYTAVTATASPPAAYPNGFLAYGRGLTLFAAAVGNGQVYWAATITAPPGSWPGKDGPTAKQDLLTRLRAQRWHPDFIAMVAGTDPATVALTDIADRDPGQPYHRGRVVLLGDAAHPMSPTMGQETNIALEDAVVLAHYLATMDVAGALAAYAADRAPRAGKIVKQSRMMGAIGQARNPFAAWARNRIMTMMFRFGNLDKQNAAVFGWQPPESSA